MITAAPWHGRGNRLGGSADAVLRLAGLGNLVTTAGRGLRHP